MRHLISTICFAFSLLLILQGCAPKLTSTYLKKGQVIYKEYDSKKEPEQTDSRSIIYAPDIVYPEHTPVRYVRVNIHFIRTNEGIGFSEEQGLIYARDILYNANQVLKRNAKMNLPIGNSTPVIPCRYQFVLSGDLQNPNDNGVYFHNDTELAYMNKKTQGTTLFNSTQFDKYGVNKGEAINVFFMEHPPDSIESPSYKASDDGVGMGKWAKIVNAYANTKQYYEWDGNRATKDAWYMAGLFNHELGHCLGLAHTWNTNDGCDDTPQNPNCWVPSSKAGCEIASNNMMDYNERQNALTPCQLGIIHYNFMHSFQRNFLVRTWCEYDEAQTVTIPQGEILEWKASRDLNGDLIVGEGAQLTISTLVNMPPSSKILLKEGATLILQNATIKNDCNLQWKGIELSGSGVLTPEVIFVGEVSLLDIENELE